MKIQYRGCLISVCRDKALGGWSEVYWSAFGPDGFEIRSGFGGGTVREMVGAMKENVDFFLDECGGNEDAWREYQKNEQNTYEQY